LVSKCVHCGDPTANYAWPKLIGRDRFDLTFTPIRTIIDAGVVVSYGFMYSTLASSMMPAGLPSPAEDVEVIKKRDAKGCVPF